MPEEQVVKIPNDIPIEEFCLFACGFTTGYGSSVNVAKIKSNHSVAIWGLGTVGLGAVMGAKDMSAKEIIGVDTNEDKFELAMKLGCTQTINPLKLSKPINEVFQVSNNLLVNELIINFQNFIFKEFLKNVKLLLNWLKIFKLFISIVF